ncbi:uncharacterized protein LOC142588778 [Dermacentor variabilis]|uniref:uncharacterized protein LOC142588778 n=1 Tax=Dermacentor variabilis TaxID=34621 RepID=UPI003F5C788E
MIKAGFARPSLIVAFALQMGVVYYTLGKEYDVAISASYQSCTGFGLADYSQACQADTYELNFEKVVIALNDAENVQVFDGRRIFQTHDTLDLMKLKASQIMAKPDTRANFTWFLFNVHLTDATNMCLNDGPFSRVKGFRDFFYREAHRQKG